MKTWSNTEIGCRENDRPGELSLYVVKHEGDNGVSDIQIRLVNAIMVAVEFPAHMIPSLKRLIAWAELQIAMLDEAKVVPLDGDK